MTSIRPLALRLAATLCCLQSITLAVASESLPVFQDGKSRIFIDVPEPLQKQLGDLPIDPIFDFARVFERMTGEQIGGAEPGKVPLRIEFLPPGSDQSPLASLPTGIRETASEISVTPESIVIRGESASGISGGLYKLLEDWGARWVLPSPLGEVVPKRDQLSLSTGNQIVKIGSDTGFGAHRPESAGWVQRNRLFPATWVPCFHYWNHGVEPEKYFKEHPEYFALVDGVRKPTQPETTHPDVVRLKIEHAKKFFRANPTARTYPMDPEDNAFFSESPESLAQDPPGTGPDGLPFMTDRVVHFSNAVLAGLKEEFPEKSVGFYSYLNHALPPVNAVLDPTTTVGVTRFGYCTLRMTPTPNSPSPAEYETLVQNWLKLTPNVYIYEYNPPSWAASLPFPNYLDMAESMRRLHKMGAKGFYSDTIFNEHSPGTFINSYIRRRMMVDPSQDPKALLQDFTQSFYGPAGAAMQSYYNTLSEVTNYRDPNRPAVGVSIYRFEEIFPRDVIARATEQLATALNTPGLDDLQKKRLEYVKLGHDYLVHYLAAVDAAKAGQLDAANRAFDLTLRQIALQERAAGSPMDDARRRIEASRSTILATYFPKERGMITDWKILGPIPRSELGQGEDLRILSQLENKPVTLGGRTYSWKTYTSPHGLLDFNTAFQRSGLDHPLSKTFASTTVDAGEAVTVTGFFSSFYPITVFLNGQQIYARDYFNFDSPDQNRAQISLRKGRNHFVILSDERSRSTRENTQNDGFDWSISLALRDNQGKPLNLPSE